MPRTDQMSLDDLKAALSLANADLAHLLDLHPDEVCEINRVKVRIMHLECRITSRKLMEVV